VTRTGISTRLRVALVVAALPERVVGRRVVVAALGVLDLLARRHGALHALRPVGGRDVDRRRHGEAEVERERRVEALLGGRSGPALAEHSLV
jgi:hypothetical protein